MRVRFKLSVPMERKLWEVTACLLLVYVSIKTGKPRFHSEGAACSIDGSGGAANHRRLLQKAFSKGNWWAHGPKKIVVFVKLAGFVLRCPGCRGVVCWVKHGIICPLRVVACSPLFFGMGMAGGIWIPGTGKLQ